MPIQFREEFRCSPEVLWLHLEEPELQKQWMKGLLSNRATSPAPTRVGSTFEMQIQEGRKVSTYQGTMTAWEPPRRMALTMQGGCFGPKAKMAVSYRLEALGPNTTALDYSCGLEQAGAVMRFFMLLFGWMAKMQARSFFKTLRKLVEKS
ncbi:MAG: SRPBCC family protein [Planctomycetes bacterium]|nr:SRPBCC family protein [Planctomycetota bacterium]